MDIKDQPCGSSAVTYSIRDDLHRPSTHLIIRVMPGLELIFSKDQKTYKFGTVEYMDFDMTKHYGWMKVQMEFWVTEFFFHPIILLKSN